MSEVININNRYFDYLAPLEKWRVLDIQSLRELVKNAPSYKSFSRILLELQKKSFLGGYRDPISKKKFVYLSPKGEKYLALGNNPCAISSETLVHDIKVTEISKALFDQGLVDQIDLEHQILDKRNFKTTYKVIPDAILHFSKNSFNYRIAMELELTRKSNARIIEKVRQYNSSEYYHYLMYLFPSMKLMEKYNEVIRGAFDEKAISRIIFMCHESLSKNVEDLDSISGHISDKSKVFREIFA